MAHRAERGECLGANGLARHQPESERLRRTGRCRPAAARPLAGHQADGVGGEQGLAAAGRNAQAHTGHLAERLRLVAVARFAFEGGAGALQAGRTQVRLKRVEGLLLVGLEGEGGQRRQRPRQ